MEPIGFNKTKAQKVCEKYNLDVLIASTPVNVFYTSGLPTVHVAPNPILYVLSNQFPNISLTRRDGEQHLIHWMLYQSTKKFTWISDVNPIMSPVAAMEGVGAKLENWGLGTKTIGIESLMPRYQAEALQKRFPNATFVNADQAFLDMRLIKTEEEVNRIKKSTQIAEKAINSMIEQTREGISDNELLQIARRVIVDEGAEGWDHLTLGINDSDPEAPGTGRQMKRGDIGRYDIGAVWQGYISDVSRHVAIGEIPVAAKEPMEQMIKLQDFCVENVKPGVKPKELNANAKAFVKSWPKKSGSSFITIHSIGLEVEEVHLMSVMKSVDYPFETNMVMDIEVWQMVKGFGLIGVEDCYRVTNSGCERLSSLDKNIALK